MGPVQVGRGCDHHLVRSDAGLHQHEFHVVSHCRRRRWRWRLFSSLLSSSLRPSFRPRRPPLAPLPRVDQPLPQARQALVLLRPPIAVEALAVVAVGRDPPPPSKKWLRGVAKVGESLELGEWPRKIGIIGRLVDYGSLAMTIVLLCCVTCGVRQHRVFNAPPISRKFTYYSYAKRTIFRT